MRNVDIVLKTNKLMMLQFNTNLIEYYNNI